MTKPLVLITGATGLIGSRTLLVLLNARYAVRIAIRRLEQEAIIRNSTTFLPFSRDLQFILVPDNTTGGAYSDAVNGVEYVVHVASPVPSKLDIHDKTAQGRTWAELFYDPAIKGTMELLRAAANTPTVKRVAITSSGNVLASVVGEEGDSASAIRRCPSWAEAEAVENAGQAYKMSKILAITAARDFVRSLQASKTCHFSVIYVCPGYVQGSHTLCENVDDFFLTTSGGTLSLATGKSLPIPVMSQVWVEDVAKAHVVGLTSTTIADGDVLVLVGNDGKGWEWNEVKETLRNEFSAAAASGILHLAENQKSMPLHFDSRQTQTILGWEFAGPAVWATEAVQQYLRLKGRAC